MALRLSSFIIDHWLSTSVVVGPNPGHDNLWQMMMVYLNMIQNKADKVILLNSFVALLKD